MKKFNDYIFNNDIAIRKTNEEVVMAFNKITGTLYEFNNTGGEILYLLKEGKIYDEVMDILCSNYSVEKKEIVDDVDDIFERLLDLKILINQ